MLANTYYEKALSNFKTAKIIFSHADGDDEQINIVGYHLQQAIELAIKHIFALNGVPFQKTHDIDQLINIANSNNIELYLPDYIKEKADIKAGLRLRKSRYRLKNEREYGMVETVKQRLSQALTGQALMKGEV